MNIGFGLLTAMFIALPGLAIIYWLWRYVFVDFKGETERLYSLFEEQKYVLDEKTAAILNYVEKMPQIFKLLARFAFNRIGKIYLLEQDGNKYYATWLIGGSYRRGKVILTLGLDKKEGHNIKVFPDQLLSKMAKFFERLKSNSLNKFDVLGRTYFVTGDSELAAKIAKAAPEIFHELVAGGKEFVLYVEAEYIRLEVVGFLTQSSEIVAANRLMSRVKLLF